MKEVLDDYKKQSAVCLDQICCNKHRICMYTSPSVILFHLIQKKKKGSSRLDKLGIPEEELLRQQQELFAQARQGMEVLV